MDVPSNIILYLDKLYYYFIFQKVYFLKVYFLFCLKSCKKYLVYTFKTFINMLYFLQEFIIKKKVGG